MEKRYYSAETLEAELRDYETHYGLSTADAIAAYEAYEVPVEGLDRFDLFVWVQTAREVERLTHRARNHRTLNMRVR